MTGVLRWSVGSLAATGRNQVGAVFVFGNFVDEQAADFHLATGRLETAEDVVTDFDTDTFAILRNDTRLLIDDGILQLFVGHRLQVRLVEWFTIRVLVGAFVQ